MSYKLTDEVFAMDLPPSEKAVLLALAHCYNSTTAKCNPSLERLRRLTGLCGTAIKDARKRLRERGLIAFLSTGGRRSNRYVLNLNPSSGDPLDGEAGTTNRSSGALLPVARRPVNQSSGAPEQGMNRERTRKKKETSPKERNRKTPKKRATPLMDLAELPSWLPEGLWTEWRTHREEIRKPMTATAERNLLGILAGMRSDGYDIEIVVRTAIASGWHGISPGYFKKRGNSNGKGRNCNPHTAALDVGEKLWREFDEEDGSGSAPPH